MRYSSFNRFRSHFAALATMTAGIASCAAAQENNALVDALVRKGILTTKEAEDIRADLAKEQASTSAGKIRLSNSVSELRLYGDFRLRYQYDNRDPQVPPFPVGVSQNGNDKDRSPVGDQNSRWGFRLRLNADFKLGAQWFGGVELQTSLNSDSGAQTYENGFNKYPIYISKAYVGWAPTDGFTITGGKFANPFYTTDLVWDPDINPNGITELIQFHKLWAGQSETGLGKDGKTLQAQPSPWELSLVAGQFIFDDNPEGGGPGGLTDNDSTTDAYLFETQLIGSYRFGESTKLTFAPAWLTYINGTVSGAVNGNAFNDNANVSGATRNLNLILLPGDISFKIGDLKTKLYWDFSYNIEGRKRVEDIYNVVSRRPGGDPDDFDSGHSNRDDFAWLVGFQIGENRKKGNWSFLANYRETGLGGVDPNLNDSDFALGELNTRGFKFVLAYNITDFVVAQTAFSTAWNLRQNLVGGEATGGNAVADSNAIEVFQFDLNVKF